MADEGKLTHEELDSIFPPSDPAKRDDWLREQIELGAREADDPDMVPVPHEQVASEMRELESELLRRMVKERSAA